MFNKNNTDVHQFNQLQQQQFHVDSWARNRKRHYGNNIILCKDLNGQPTLMLGPHWYIFVFAFLTTITLIGLLLYSMYDHLNQLWFVILIISAIIYSYSYLRIGLSYPGFIQPPSTWPPSGQELRICQTCHVIKTPTSFHCSDCNVCIQGFDHHCPWIGKCVGARNLCSFYFFLIMIFGTLIMCFVATIASAEGRRPSVGGNGQNMVISG